MCFLTFWIFLTFDMLIFWFDCFAKTTFEGVNLSYFCSIFELKMWFFHSPTSLFYFFNFVVYRLKSWTLTTLNSPSRSLSLSLSISLHLSLLFSNTCSRSFSLSTSFSLCFLVCVCLQDLQAFSVRVQFTCMQWDVFFWFCLLKIGFEIVREI